jgi:hypothetical protein
MEKSGLLLIYDTCHTIFHTGVNVSSIFSQLRLVYKNIQLEKSEESWNTKREFSYWIF